MSDARIPLATLRARLREPLGDRTLRRWIAQLEGDPRAGARDLAAVCARRLAEQRQERQRLAGLFALRRRLRAEGALRVAGVDEVGVGPLAGPVVAAAVVLEDAADQPGLNDSKRLDRRARERLAAAIRAQASALCIAQASPEEVDRLNVYHAALQAMRRAVLGLVPLPDHVLVDARTIPDLVVAQTPLVGGDARDASIAAASILAKVHRDALMRRLDERHPGYGFSEHKGYATAAHLRALQALGPSPVHRRSFAPVTQLRLW